MKSLAAFLACLVLAGCASYTDLNSKPGASPTGGFKDQKLAEGVYFVEAVSGMAPWKYPRGAHDTFNRRAAELCGDDRFVVLFLHEETGTPTGSTAYKTTTVVGYIRDDDSPLSLEEAKRAVNAKRAERGLYEITRWNR